MKRQTGFTLVEMIIVMVLIGIIGAMLSMQLAPSIRSYLLVSQRANLTNQADTALRKIVGEVRGAVPNSLRLDSATCLELVPSKDGGRYRTAPDAALAGTAFLDGAEARDRFDVLTPFSNPPVAGDAIVIGNQNPDDVYNGVNVGAVDSVAPPPNPAMGEQRVVLTAPIRVPPGYTQGRFIVVPAGQRVVTYVCDEPGVNLEGTGTGTLYRVADAAFHTTPACTRSGGAVVATKVAACSFIYSPNQGATQESGFVQLQLTLSERGESASLTLGAHVDNVP